MLEPQPVIAYSAPSLTQPEPDPNREKSAFFIGYEISLPVGSLKDFTDAASYRGFDLGGLWPIVGGLKLGAYFNHHLFYEELGRETYPLENGAVTANLYRFARFWTTGAMARYHFLPASSVFRPYVGVRTGIAFATTATLVSDLSLYNSPVGFAIAPELGGLVALNDFLALSGSLRYDFSTLSEGPLENGSYLAFQLGLVFTSNQ